MKFPPTLKPSSVNTGLLQMQNLNLCVGKWTIKSPFSKKKKPNSNPSISQQLTSCYHSYPFLYEEGTVLSSALTEKRAQTKPENEIGLRAVRRQCTGMQLPVLEYSSETAKEFFSFYKWLGLRGLLKICF